jgi:hypothetical protein
MSLNPEVFNIPDNFTNKPEHTGLQVAGLVVDLLGQACERYAVRILTAMSQIAAAAAAAADGVSVAAAGGGAEWEGAYYAIIAAEKLLTALPRVADAGDGRSAVAALSSRPLLRHWFAAAAELLPFSF